MNKYLPALGDVWPGQPEVKSWTCFLFVPDLALALPAASEPLYEEASDLREGRQGGYTWPCSLLGVRTKIACHTISRFGPTLAETSILGTQDQVTPGMSQMWAQVFRKQSMCSYFLNSYNYAKLLPLHSKQSDHWASQIARSYIRDCRKAALWYLNLQPISSGLPEWFNNV